MNLGAKSRAPRPALLLWWVIWLGLLAGFLQVWYFLRTLRSPEKITPAMMIALLVGVGLLTVSTAIRWLLLPRIARAPVAFVLFIVGLVLAETCGYIGIFFGGAARDALVTGGVAGMLQYLPRFARRFFAAPAGARFRS